MTTPKVNWIYLIDRITDSAKIVPNNVKKKIIKRYVEDSLENQLDEYNKKTREKIINDTSDQILKMDDEDIIAIIKFYHKKMKNDTSKRDWNKV